uniref:Uncharacterized protein n=1 Tax=Labrus bergylta TaxID=56723 RepID=A0A3Q3FHA8_9LABR
DFAKPAPEFSSLLALSLNRADHFHNFSMWLKIFLKNIINLNAMYNINKNFSQELLVQLCSFYLCFYSQHIQYSFYLVIIMPRLHCYCAFRLIVWNQRDCGFFLKVGP